MILRPFCSPHSATGSRLPDPKYSADCLPSSSVKCPFLRSFLYMANINQHSQARQLETLIARSSADSRALTQSYARRTGTFDSLSTLKHLTNSGSERYTKVKSGILVIGLSVHTAPVEMRENLAVPEADLTQAIEELSGLPHIEEATILSTCNRIEIYVVALSWHMGVIEVSHWMSKVSGIPLGKLREHLFVLQDQDAIQHLFRVASGLDSLILGEGQILAQVKQVLKLGQSAHGFGRTLSALFKQAIAVGKRVRNETSIATGSVSVSSAAVELAATKLHGSSFCNVNVAIIGAGKMANLLIKHLISKGCTRMVVVNRTEQRVRDLQILFPEAVLTFRPFNEMMKCAGEADVVFTSTSSEVPLLSKSMVEALPPAGAYVCGIRHFIDISVPRNVATCVRELPSTQVYNVDDLREVIATNMEERREKALDAQYIIDEEMVAFSGWRDSLKTVPTIKKLRAYAEKIRLGELQKCLGKMGVDLSQKDRRLIDELSRSIVNKLLHGPMTHLRCDDNGGRSAFEILENMHALERVFDLE